MRILIATFPADGHFNPLTSLAKHLAGKGHDVRWYCGPSYAARLAALGIPHFDFRRARDVNGENLAEVFPEYSGSVFDLHVATAKALFQIGVPSLDYPRDDWPASFEFIGALLPERKPSTEAFAYEAKLRKFGSLVVVSQGTVDNRDPEKLLVPTLEALRGGRHLVIATTGRRNTEALRARFPEDNVVVEDYMDFDVLLERADLFVCNGGYGSVLQALSKGVPLLSAGKLEGKIDVNARLDWAGVGLDLRTERPSARQIAKGVERVLGDARIAANVARVQQELASYRPLEIIERRILADAGSGTSA